MDTFPTVNPVDTIPTVNHMDTVHTVNPTDISPDLKTATFHMPVPVNQSMTISHVILSSNHGTGMDLSSKLLTVL